MSAANFRLVQDLYDAFARRDVPAVLARLDPDVERQQTELVPWPSVGPPPDRGTVQGR